MKLVPLPHGLILRIVAPALAPSVACSSAQPERVGALRSGGRRPRELPPASPLPDADALPSVGVSADLRPHPARRRRGRARRPDGRGLPSPPEVLADARSSSRPGRDAVAQIDRRYDCDGEGARRSPRAGCSPRRRGSDAGAARASRRPSARARRGPPRRAGACAQVRGGDVVFLMPRPGLHAQRPAHAGDYAYRAPGRRVRYGGQGEGLPVRAVHGRRR